MVTEASHSVRLIVPDLFDPPWAEKLQIAIPSKAEGSHRGLVRLLGKQVWGKPHREFESHTLRFEREKVYMPARVSGATVPSLNLHQL